MKGGRGPEGRRGGEESLRGVIQGEALQCGLWVESGMMNGYGWWEKNQNSLFFSNFHYFVLYLCTSDVVLPIQYTKSPCPSECGIQEHCQLWHKQL